MQVQMTQEQMQAEIARLQAENAQLVKKATPGFSAGEGLGIKVSAKGAASLYGLGRFPVTLYKSQWLRIIEVVENGTLKAFLSENAEKLVEKSK